MFKIRKISFDNHSILGNLTLDFCGKDGKAVDTVIFAGENGTGKSAILETLYKIASYTIDFPLSIEFENEEGINSLLYHWRKDNPAHNMMYVRDKNGNDCFISNSYLKQHYPFSSVFSDIEINFHTNEISSVTSLSLDAQTESRRSDNNLPTQIKQLLIDIQALDDGDVARAVRTNPNIARSQLTINERMPRFTRAFNQIFENLSYSHIENRNNHKSVVFTKYGKEISIDQLSSGEKQIVYRGCFLLKDVNAMNGAFVFIDEPEISLHPSWQKKIMEYYKGIFTDENGAQTSQIFAVTHSPFIIHNENRKNDKVIVLSRDNQGNVVAKDNPEYYYCDSVKVVEDAFSIKDFSVDKPTVYLEGRTDEKYFNKALEVFGLNVPFQFKWVGYMDDRGQEVNTGDKSVDAAYQFLVSGNLPIKNFCVKDCDTRREATSKNNVTILSIPQYDNSKGMRKGIENALVLDNIDLTPYYTEKNTVGDYGESKTIQTFDKMKCCDAICAMENDFIKEVFVHLKETIDRIIKLYNEE